MQLYRRDTYAVFMSELPKRWCRRIPRIVKTIKSYHAYMHKALPLDVPRIREERGPIVLTRSTICVIETL